MLWMDMPLACSDRVSNSRPLRSNPINVQFLQIDFAEVIRSSSRLNEKMHANCLIVYAQSVGD